MRTKSDMLHVLFHHLYFLRWVLKRRGLNYLINKNLFSKHYNMYFELIGFHCVNVKIISLDNFQLC